MKEQTIVEQHQEIIVDLWPAINPPKGLVDGFSLEDMATYQHFPYLVHRRF